MQAIDCENLRREIVQLKESKQNFDNNFLADSKDCDFRLLRSLKKHQLEPSLDFLKKEVGVINGYKFTVEAVIAQSKEIGEEVEPREKVKVETRIKNGEEIKIIAVQGFLNLKDTEDIDSRIPDNLTTTGDLYLVVHGHIYVDASLVEEAFRIKRLGGLKDKILYE